MKSGAKPKAAIGATVDNLSITHKSNARKQGLQKSSRYATAILLPGCICSGFHFPHSKLGVMLRV